MEAVRTFNIAGPCRPDRHYMIPAGRRLPGFGPLVDKQAYFVVHAPRQTGKTTTMKALARRLTEEGRHAALHFSCETARAFPEDVEQAVKGIWLAIEGAARLELPQALRPPAPVEVPAAGYLQTQLTRWAEACPRPLVLVFDEIDALTGSTLLSVLSQLRAGFPDRPAAFPWSLVLCGARDVRDYKAASGGGPVRMGSSSPFNIKEESLRLGDFTEAEVRDLYGQHTDETGQPFAEEALAKAFELTQGQPWLTNALAREVVEKIQVPADQPITAAHIEAAKERVILARATHLDSLLARLAEGRVRRIIEPVLAGELTGGKTFDADFEHAIDLGLVAPGLPVRIANPIYREIILRVLASSAEAAIDAEPHRYRTPDGRLDVDRLLHDFAEFWRQHGEIVVERVDYQEAAPQLVLMAFLHRVVNGGGGLEREVGAGRKRIDVLVRWPYVDAAGRRAEQRVALEIKVWRDRDKMGDPLVQGLGQLDEYLRRLGLDEGVLAIFDCRSAAAPIEERTRFEEARTPSGRRGTVLRA
ncbi:ATP-binding protein [Sorangium sp. So ce406]|uniref:ATP-binding protein n=1 Tax=Sorangium sp. So ce406 TaxID=3133311 RepID=UPI003F5AE0F6